MIVLDIEQGSDAWHKARIAIPTASNFDKIITPTGKASTQARKYMLTLAVEAVTGLREESYQSSAMLRGVELEPQARAFYEFTTGNQVEKTGFIFNDEKSFGCSPDGLVGDDGLIEIKCPLAHTIAEYLLDGEAPSEYVPQIQGQLLITGRKWTDFLAYFPNLKPLLIRVERDEVYIAKLKELLDNFNKELKQTVEKLK